MSELEPGELLGEARRFLEEASPGTISVWPRATALLARQALEGAMRRFWQARAFDVQWLPMRAQLQCLGAYVPSEELARDIAFAWRALTRATHHHPYELDPTKEELGSLVASAERAVAELLAAVAPQPAGSGARSGRS